MLTLYPLAFRRRYGLEMRGLLEETPIQAMTLFDLLRGALAAHLKPPAGIDSALDAGDRLRASMSGVLACWVAFAAAGFGFYKTTEDDPFEAAGNAHPLLGGAHLAIQALAVVASIAVLAGALPLILTAIGRARRHHHLRVLVSIPVIAVIVFAALTAGFVLLAHSQRSHHATSAGRAAFVAWTLAGLGCGAICVVSSRRALFAVPVRRIWLLTALAGATLVTTAMVAMAVATAIYTITLPLDASTLAGMPNGPLGLASTSVSLIEQVIVMILAGMLAVTATRRGWRAVIGSRIALLAPPRG
jgi:hypothetical protein